MAAHRGRTGVRRYVNPAVDVLGFVAGFAALVLGLLNTQEVVRRYILKAPTEWAFEIGEYLLLPIGFLGLAYILRLGRHVEVDILYLRFGRRLRSVVDVINPTIILIFALVLTYEFIGIAREYYAVQYTSGSVLDFPRWPLVILVLFGTAALCIEAALEVYEALGIALRGGRDAGGVREPGTH